MPSRAVSFGECAGCTVANTTPQSFTMTLAGVDVTSRATTPAPYNTYFNSTSFELEQRSANPCQFRGQFTDLPADLYQGGSPIVAIRIEVEIGGGVSNTFAVTIGWYSDDACTVFVGNLIVAYTASDHAGSLAQHGGDCDTQPATATEFYRNGASDWNQAGGEIPEFTITLSPGPSLPCVPA